MQHQKVFDGTATTVVTELHVDTRRDLGGGAPYRVDVANYDDTSYLLVALGEGSQDFISLQPGNGPLSFRTFFTDKKHVYLKTLAGDAAFQVTCHY